MADGLNACYECCDRHAEARPNAPALFYHREGEDGATFSFGELRDLSARFANLLSAQGVQPGDRVAALLPSSPELLVTILGAWRAGAVYQPLFTAFAAKIISHRLSTSKARLIVTNTDHRAKLEPGAGGAGAVVVVNASGSPLAGGDLDFWASLKAHSDRFEPVILGADEPFLQMFTSGTTSTPKSVAVPLRALVGLYNYARDAVGLREGDQLWCVAEPGWAYGLYAGVVGPLAAGHAILLYNGPYSAATIIELVQQRKVTHLAGSPTVYRLLAAAGAEAVRPIKGQLRAVSSAGEYLAPDLVQWFKQHLGVSLHDHYGQTELGLVLANHHGLLHPVRPDTVGFPAPGWRLVVLDQNDEELPPGAFGVLAVDSRNSPLFWFRGYHGQEPFKGRYYRTGDTVEMNPDGSFAYIGRPGGVGLEGAVNIRAPSAKIGKDDKAIWRKRAVSPDTTRKKKEFVLRVACQMINERGFAATSMGDISARLEVSKPTLYYYFHNKDDILFEALSIGLRQLRGVAASRKSGLSGSARLAEILRAYLDVVAVGYGGGLIRATEYDLSEAGRPEFRRQQSEYESIIAEAVSEARAEGAVEAADLGLVTAILLGALNRVALAHDPRTNASLYETSQKAVETLLVGLEPRS